MRRYVLFALAFVGSLLLSSEIAFSLPLAGIGPDLIIIVIATFSIGERPRTAAVMAFAAGLFRDLLLTTPVGLSALAYSVTAYAVAMIEISRSAWAVVGLVSAATFASQVIYGAGATMLSPQVDASPLPRIVFLTTVYNALIVPLLMPLLRRVIRTEGAGQDDRPFQRVMRGEP